ncbi:MAG: aldose 1-epimerase [Microscillaceae bacterium]|nr:aldose 1-epimerase [Microscillaceae bacterium]
MFQVRKEKFGSYLQYKLINTQTDEYVSILPEWGSILNEMQIRWEDSFLNIIDGYADPEELKQTYKKTFKGSKLSPYPNRIREGKYTFEGIDYQLDINFPHENNSIHGFLDDQVFEVLEEAHSTMYASLLLSHHYDGNINGYPFPYKIKVLYSFDIHNTLRVNTLIKNTGDRNMPLGHGWHPYFRTGNPIDSWEIQFAPTHQYLLDEKMIPTGATAPFTEFQGFKPIGDFDFDTAFALNSSHEAQTFRIRDLSKNLEINVVQETGPNKYNFSQVFSPPHRQSLAIEPMTCAPNAFNNQIGLIVLAPGATIGFEYQIQIYKVY